MEKESKLVKLTEFSHSAGCGCKLSQEQLSKVLSGRKKHSFDSLIIGSDHNDDAVVYRIQDDLCAVSTVDFFMPIVNDPYDFGRVAAVNAINDLFAMGAKPTYALSMLGWPVSKLDPEIAAEVIKGAEEICSTFNIPLAGGHSIDNLEPLFGLAVNGIIREGEIKRNSSAKAGDLIVLTKGLGTGILATALKRGLLDQEGEEQLLNDLLKSNAFGVELAQMKAIHAMTDVTGFGLLGHLVEMCKGSGLSATIDFESLPLLNPTKLNELISQFVVPDNTFRNFNSYKNDCNDLNSRQMQILCDPQTSGGLLLAVDPTEWDSVSEELKALTDFSVIGEFSSESTPWVKVNS